MARKLSAQQLQAVELDAQGCSGVEIARQLGIDPTTVCRWRARADFKAAANELLHQAREGLEHRLQGLAVRAANTLDDALSGKPGYSGSDRIRAAGMVLELLKLEGVKPGPRTPEGVERQQDFEFLDELTGSC